MRNTFPKTWTITSTIFGFIFNASILFAETNEVKTQETQNTTSELASEEFKSGDNFISNGQEVLLKDVNYNVQTIKDWKVFVGNNSLVMKEVLPQDLDDTKTVYGEAVYRKNVQFLVYNESLPFDQKRFDEITSYLTTKIGENSSFTNFQIDEQKLIDLNGKNDAYIIYTSMQHKDMKMRQMHILMAGTNKQVLSSFTDLSDSFEKNQTSMESAWNAMTATILEGNPTYRHQTLLNTTPILATLILSLMIIFIVKRLRETKTLKVASKEINTIYAKDENIEDLESNNWDLSKTKITTLEKTSNIVPAFTTDF